MIKWVLFVKWESYKCVKLLFWSRTGRHQPHILTNYYYELQPRCGRLKKILQAIENMLQRNDSKLCQQQKQQHRINNRNDHGGNNNNNNNNSSNNDSINIVWILWEDEEPYLGDYCFTLDMETDCGIFYGVVQLHLVVSLNTIYTV